VGSLGLSALSIGPQHGQCGRCLCASARPFVPRLVPGRAAAGLLAVHD